MPSPFPLPVFLAVSPAADHGFLADLVVILVSAGLVALVLQRFRLAIIPAYLITGAIIGPHALHFIPSEDGLAGISQIAIVLLMFGIGLELHLSVIKHNLTRTLLTGVGSCLLTVILLWPMVMAFGVSAPGALALAMALSLSSTAVVLRILAERRELRHARGRLSFSVLVIQDLVVILMLAMLPLIARWGNPEEAQRMEVLDSGTGWLGFIVEAVIRIGLVTLLFITGRWFLPRIVSASLRTRSLQLLMVIGVAVALLAAYVASRIGFSLEMGAFLAGFLLASTPFRHQLSGQIAPLRDLFIAVFFTSLGMQLNLPVVMSYWWVILLAVPLLLVAKSAAIGFTSWAFGAPLGTAMAVGLALSQAGEFSLILFSAAQNQGLVSGDIFAVSVAVVVITLILTPPLLNAGARVSGRDFRFKHAPWVRLPARPSIPETGTEGTAQPAPKHVIVAGFGPAGRYLTDKLEAAGIETHIIELNYDTVREQMKNGREITFGDASNPEVLSSAGLDIAEALLLTIPDDEAALRALKCAREQRPDVFVAMRVASQSHQQTALDAGANQVVVEETATAEQMLRGISNRLTPPRGDRGSLIS